MCESCNVLTGLCNKHACKVVHLCMYSVNVLRIPQVLKSTHSSLKNKYDRNKTPYNATI